MLHVTYIFTLQPGNKKKLIHQLPGLMLVHLCKLAVPLPDIAFFVLMHLPNYLLFI